MPDLDNMTLLQKADLALSDLTSGGGILQPETAKQFMRILIEEAVLMKMATVYPMKSYKTEIPKARFGGRVLRAGAVSTPLASGDRAKPTLTNVELDAQLFKAEVDIPTEVLEDNIERDQFKNTIMQMLAERIATDMDEIAINGDTASGDPFLAKFNGILKQVTSHIVDANGAPLTKAVLKQMIKALPKEFHRTINRLRYLTSVNAEIDYRDSLMDRETPGGDALINERGEARYSGVPVVAVPMFPEDLGTDTDETNVILTDPKNIVFGIWRDIRIESDKDIRAGTYVIVATLRFDVKLAEETAAVKATEVAVVDA